MRAELVPTTALAGALQLGDHALVSLVGGGGKTTALFALGQQVRGTTIMTTTTKMGSSRTDDHHLAIGPNDDELTKSLAQHQRLLVWSEVDGPRALGVDAASCDRWFDLADHVIVEADGSRRRPFKAPADHEPVIPTRTTVLVACIGAAALGEVIAEHCHRPELVAAVAGCSPTDRLTPERAAAVLMSSDGSRRHEPAAARFVIAISRVRHEHRNLVDALVDQLDSDAHVVCVSDDTDLTHRT